MNYKIRDLLNIQINKELEAAYLYLEFSNFFDSNGLDGYAHYYRVQAKEEINHAMLIYDYLHKANQEVKLMVIKAPEVSYNNIEEVLDAGLSAEKQISKYINDIYNETISSSDFASKIFIRWFVKEQFDEETSAQKMIDEYKLYKNDLYLLNKKYLNREYKKYSL